MMRPPCVEPLENRIAPAFGAIFELSSLDGTNGFRLNGAAPDDFAGIAVSEAGDVNGDGFGDIIIGAYGADPGGAIYLVFGAANGFAPNLNLSGLDGSNGFRLTALDLNTYLGISVSGAGDINGDGFGDLIVGAPNASANGNNSGASYVVFGKANGFAPTINLSDLNGVGGFRMSGAAAYDKFGRNVSEAGDVNGDGFDDLIIGAIHADPNGSNSGASYVVFGKPSGFVNFSIGTLNGTNGFKVSGVAAFDIAGGSVSAAGDINDDGFGDVIIGAPNANTNGPASGAAYVVFGKAGGFAPNINLSSLNSSNGFVLRGVATGDQAGSRATAAGDINGDGFGDLIIGASRANANALESGASYVVFGKATPFGAIVELAALDGLNGFKISGVAAKDRAGGSVGNAGDVNGDGFDDVIVGAAGADPNSSYSGASYVIFGKSSGFTANLNLSSLEGGNGFKLAGVGFDDQSGVAVSGAGDVNGDGFADVIIGAPLAEPHGYHSGASYVVFGGPSVELRISDAEANERNSAITPLSFAVTLSEAGPAPITVQVSALDGSAVTGSDFTGLSPLTLTFAPGEISKNVPIDLLGDTTFETDETFTVVLSAATGGVIRDGMGTGTILNDDAPPLVNITAGSLLEGSGGTSNLAFTVSLSEASGLPVSVQFASTEGTAVAGSDYTAPVPGTLIFSPGEVSKTITVDVLGDTSIEDHESFSVILSAANGATIGTGVASGTILNDDTALRIASVSARETDSGITPFVFTVSLEKPSAIPVTVNYATADATATAGSDYEGAPPTQLTFAPGETTRTVAIDVTGDMEVEAHETFSVILSAGTGAVIVEGTATGTILNDETLVLITDASMLEGHSAARTMNFVVSLTSPTTLPVSVRFASVDGSATSGTDYTALSGTLEFAPGETNKTIAVDVLGDRAVEPSETFSIVLADAINAIIDDSAGIGTILDDDVKLVSPRKATFKDVDGELVTIKVSRGTLKVEDFTIFPSGQGAQLALVDFKGETAFSGANLKITAKAVSGVIGDGLVNVGQIEATGIDLGTVRLKGDLGQIDAGDTVSLTPGVLALSATSLGRSGLATQLPGGSSQSDIRGALTTLKLRGDLQDAALLVSGGVGTITIKGSVLGGVIRSDKTIGALQITGDLAASVTGQAIISARGILEPTATKQAFAIAGLRIGGSVSGARILAGYDRAGVAVNADVEIGPVRIGGDWFASDLVAGVAAGPDNFFGNDDDTLISRENPMVARIAAVVIKGIATGTEGGADHFGFVAEQIDSFKAGGIELALNAGPGNDRGVPVGSSGDLKVLEVG